MALSHVEKVLVNAEWNGNALVVSAHDTGGNKESGGNSHARMDILCRVKMLTRRLYSTRAQRTHQGQ